MTASSGSSMRQRVAIDRIATPANVRELDSEHVDALAASIKLRCLLVAVIVRPLGEASSRGRLSPVRGAPAARQEYIDVDVRDAEGEDADRAMENIARKQLDAHEEARAVEAMLDDGLTEDGAAQALGWPKAGSPPA